MIRVAGRFVNRSRETGVVERVEDMVERSDHWRGVREEESLASLGPWCSIWEGAGLLGNMGP